MLGSLGLMGAAPPSFAQEMQVGQVQADQVLTRRVTALRAAPDSVARTVATVPAQTALQTLPGRFGPWLQVSTAQGVVGWLQVLEVSVTSTRPIAGAAAQPPSPQAMVQPQLATPAIPAASSSRPSPLLPLPPLSPFPPPPPLAAAVPLPHLAASSSAPVAGTGEPWVDRSSTPGQGASASNLPDLAAQRLLQAETYRLSSEEARKFAFSASLELVKLPRLNTPVTATSADATAVKPAPLASSRQPSLPTAVPAAANADAALAAPPLDRGNTLLRRMAEADGRIDEGLEAEAGRELALLLLADKPLSNDPALQRYVNLLGRWLSLESSRPDLAWTFAVLDDRATQGIALPGGYVFITRGLLDKLGTEAELASVLAHEVTHVADKYPLKALVRKASAEPKASLGDLARGLYSQGNSADDELSADRSAVVLLARTGFNPDALASAILLTNSNGPGKTLLSSLIGPDAMAKQRLAQLKRLRENHFDALSGKPSPRIAQRLGLLEIAQ